MTTKPPATCRRVDDTYLTRQHHPDCKSTACTGCQPCTHDHAGNPVRHCPVRRYCTSHLSPLEHACPDCLGRIRRNLRTIPEQLARMPAWAIDAGIESEQMMLTRPAQHPADYTRQQVANAAAGLVTFEPDYRDPYYALVMREQHIRWMLGHPPTCAQPLTRTTDYLDRVLDQLATPEHLPLLADLARTARSIHDHLDQLEHNSHLPDLGAPCPNCGPKPPQLQRRRSHWCTRPDCTREHDATGAKDTWECPSCGAWWTEADYRLWVSEDAHTLRTAGNKRGSVVP